MHLINQIKTKLPLICRVGVGVGVGVGVLHQRASYSQLKVHWRRDHHLDSAIVVDQKWRLCARVVKEVLNEPNSVIPLWHLEKRRSRLKLKVKASTFLIENPFLFELYYDRIKPKSDLVKFIRPSEHLNRFLEFEKRAYLENEPLVVERMCKLLMMATNNLISVEKLAHVKREFGFPNDFMSSIIGKYPNYFRLTGGDDGKEFLQLVSWEEKFAKSVIIKRAEEEESLTGVRARPQFDWKLPKGFLIKKPMREWVRDWMAMPYVNPYDDASNLDPGSPEMEKRRVGVFHEVLSLSLLKRLPIPILGKFTEDFRLSNAFASTFTRHSGLFYTSLKGGIKTAVLREAYKDGVLIDRDPLLEIKAKFVDLLEEGWKVRREESKSRREAGKKRLDERAAKDSRKPRGEIDELSDVEFEDSDEQCDELSETHFDESDEGF